MNARWVDFDLLEALFGEPVAVDSIEVPDEFPYQRPPAELASGADRAEAPAGPGWIVVTVAAVSIVLVGFGWRYMRNQRLTGPTRKRS
jgi:hypothetical protein